MVFKGGVIRLIEILGAGALALALSGAALA